MGHPALLGRRFGGPHRPQKQAANRKRTQNLYPNSFVPTLNRPINTNIGTTNKTNKTNHKTNTRTLTRNYNANNSLKISFRNFWGGLRTIILSGKEGLFQGITHDIRNYPENPYPRNLGGEDFTPQIRERAPENTVKQAFF